MLHLGGNIVQPVLGGKPIHLGGKPLAQAKGLVQLAAGKGTPTLGLLRTQQGPITAINLIPQSAVSSVSVAASGGKTATILSEYNVCSSPLLVMVVMRIVICLSFQGCMYTSGYYNLLSRWPNTISIASCVLMQRLETSKILQQMNKTVDTNIQMNKTRRKCEIYLAMVDIFSFGLEEKYLPVTKQEKKLTFSWQ